MIPKENYIGFRTDLKDYFKWMTGVPENKKSFTPFIFRRGSKMYAKWHWRKLLAYLEEDVLEDDVVIMQVWPGHFRCDCFIFTLEDLQEYLDRNNIKP